MTPLKTENLDLTFDNNVAHIAVTGAMDAESLAAGLERMDALVEANDNFNIRIDMAKDDFADLSEIRGEFTRVGRLLRHATAAEKCAVLTDSMFLRNSAKVEGAVIPGLEINTFAPDAADVADKWLRDKPVSKAGREAAKEDAQPTPTGKMHASYGPAPTDIETVSPKVMKTAKPDNVPMADDAGAETKPNPWDNFTAL